MFKISDLVQHKITGTVGRVFGYGCQVSGRIYFMTLKVKPLKGRSFQAYVEDKMDEWHLVRLDDPESRNSGLRRLRRLKLVA
ncbi:MAG: hypothetical protein RLZZ574_2333 [Cyanobacteriota bacterium]|jgi:hypothetical protein